MNQEKIKLAIDEIRPSLQADGGDIEFVDVTKDNIVQVRLTGACHGCPMAKITLHQGVEAYLKKAIPEIEGIVDLDAPEEAEEHNGCCGKH